MAKGTVEQETIWPREAFNNRGVLWVKKPQSPSSSLAWINEHGVARRCAIIGSGASLRGKTLGSTIDEHDLVVRVNRLPDTSNRSQAADLGTRTDVWFSKLCRVSKMEQFINETNGPYLTLEGMQGTKLGGAKCFLSNKALPPACPFRAFIARGGGTCMERLSIVKRASRVDFPVGMQSRALYKAGRQLVNKPKADSVEATTGFHAILTCVSLCQSLSVFGFTGAETLDGHELRGHSIGKEHAILTAFAREHFGRVNLTIVA